MNGSYFEAANEKLYPSRNPNTPTLIPCPIRRLIAGTHFNLVIKYVSTPAAHVNAFGFGVKAIP
jgi:hypothetical protein